ncbi:MAG: lysophospholipid acyltransferase family protein [Acidobacteriota bacterium]|nr:lysophospholipid acyltransferase family protein [Acidobacteriota bacterium]
MSDRPSLLRRLEAAILLPLAALLRTLPPRGRVAVGHALGSLVHALDSHHRKLARDNLRAALGVDPPQAARLAHQAFRHFGRVAVECLALPAYLRPDAESLFEVEGLEHLAAAHARGKGVIVFSAHMGNWELVAQRQALAGFPMDFIARPLDNPWLEAAINRWRELPGNRVLGKHGALRRAMQSLRAGRALAILIDQNVRVPPRFYFPFFGRNATTTQTLGHFALRLGAPVVPVVSIPRPDGGYRIVYHPPLDLPAAESGDLRQRARALTEAASRMIEGWIRDNPGTWLWLHDRWKSRPRPGEEV